MNTPKLLQTLERCEDDTSIVLPNGARFVRKLPGDAPLAFLHTLYPPLKNCDIAIQEAALGRRLPEDFASFLTFADGAALFAGVVSLSGFSENAGRSTRLEDQRAISILWENEMFAASSPGRWKSGWIRIGAVSGWDSQFSIELHVGGVCAILDDSGREASFVSFSACLDRIIDSVQPYFSCDGLIDQSYATLETSLGSLIPHA